MTTPKLLTAVALLTTFMMLSSCACRRTLVQAPSTPAPAPAPAAEPEPGPVPEPVVDRLALVEAEYARYGEAKVEHSAAELPAGEQQLLRHLLAAASLIEELHMLQLHPSNLEWRDHLAERGTEAERELFTRYQHPWCQDDPSPECCALPDCPPKAIGHAHWPADLTEEEFAGLGELPNGAELLSPFTMVTRGADGALVAVPYAQTELFGPRMREVASELRAAAAHAPHPSLARFLTSRAAAFEAEEPFPFDDSDYDWIALEGDWEVTVGPYESYKNPRQLKALFEMYVGREDREITAALGQLKANLQQMEDALSVLVGPDIYRSRTLDPRIAIRAVEIWMASGDGRRDRGATVAFHLPNRGRSVDEGLYKKVMMVNHSRAFEPVMRARAALILDPAQQDLIDFRAAITNVTFHELAHGFGAHSEMKVTDPAGQQTTVSEAMGDLRALIEEAKADVFGLWLLQFQRARGWIDDHAVRQRYTSAILHVLGLLQYPLTGTYPRMTAIAMGWYLDAGAVTWDPAEGRFTIDYDQLPAAVESLAKQVATLQLTGDYAGARALYGRYIVDHEDGSHSLKGVVGEARAAMMAKFEAAGIRSPSLRYEVTGL